MGVIGKTADKTIAIGNELLMKMLHLSFEDLNQKSESFRIDGQSILFIAIDELPAGFFTFSDRIKDSTFEAIEALRQEKVHVIMLTGDHTATALAIGKKLGIDEIRAEIL